LNNIMTNKSYIVTLSVILVIILIVFLVWPKYQDLRASQLAVRQGEENLRVEEEYFAEIINLSKKLRSHEGALERVDSALPDEMSLPAVFDYFQKTAAKTGLVLEEINPEGNVHTEDDASEVIETHISMSLSGKYDPDLNNFLSAIEGSARLFAVEQISFYSPEDSNEPFSFDIKLKTHGY